VARWGGWRGKKGKRKKKKKRTGCRDAIGDTKA